MTAETLIVAAFRILNIFQPGETVPSVDAQSALEFLNRMVGAWAQQALTIPTVAREVFSTVANQGGPTNPYTIGDGGDLDTQRPPNQSNVVGAGLLLGGSSPLVEIPRALLTDDAWQSIQVKDLSNPLFTDVYYNPTYADGLGTINLWPVPDNDDNGLVLYLQKALVSFTSLTAVYDVPSGYEEALLYNLVRRMAKPWGRPLEPDDLRMATSSLKVIKRMNLKLTDLPTDLAWTGDRRYGYNIQTGNL